MRAAIYRDFRRPFRVEEVPDPTPPEHGVVVRVKATGLCRSDWHGWMGHEPDIALPHVPGHEFAGVVAEVGGSATECRVGDRVTAPFVCGCGRCPECASGNHQVCPHQTQPGFTHWGSFAEYVVVHHADVNLVSLPGEMEFATAASLGCRFATAYRAVVDQGRASAEEWVAVHGCGGVGLSAIMIARAVGARVVAVDIAEEKLALARAMGAEAVVNAAVEESVSEAVRGVTDGGAHLSLDALGSRETAAGSVACLRRRGRHLQVGLLAGEHRHPPIPMDRVIAWELEILGSHGMQAHRYGEMLTLIREGKLNPDRLIGDRISLEAAPAALAAMDDFPGTGVTVIGVS